MRCSWPHLTLALALGCSTKSEPSAGTTAATDSTTDDLGSTTTDTDTPLPNDDQDGDGTPDDEDCGPTNPAINPEATDIVGDDIDQNCDGIDGTDIDQDGEASTESGGLDCDDHDATIHSAASDGTGDGVDANCDGVDGVDADGDGQASAASGGTDCDDTDPTVFDEDRDRDGWTSCGGDCDDNDAALTPEDIDGDGWSTCDGDCDETRDYIHPYDTDTDNIDDTCGWKDVAAGANHTCAIDSDGMMWCWGDNTYGQASPQPGPWKQLDGLPTGQTTCGINAWDSVTCWGQGGSTGRLRNAPSSTFSTITVGADHACGITTTGDAECWGQNDMGETTAPAGTFVDVAPVDTQLSCGIDTLGGMVCWGYWETITSSVGVPGTYQRLIAYETARPAALDTSGTPWAFRKWCTSCSIESTELNAMYALEEFDGTCGVDAAGLVQCWTTTAGVPTVAVRTYAGGTSHGCAILDTDGSLVCWGSNASGQINVPR